MGSRVSFYLLLKSRHPLLKRSCSNTCSSLSRPVSLRVGQEVGGGGPAGTSVQLPVEEHLFSITGGFSSQAPIPQKLPLLLLSALSVLSAEARPESSPASIHARAHVLSSTIFESGPLALGWDACYRSASPLILLRRGFAFTRAG